MHENANAENYTREVKFLFPARRMPPVFSPMNESLVVIYF